MAKAKKYPMFGYRDPKKPEDGKLSALTGMYELLTDYFLGIGAGYLFGRIAPEESRPKNLWIAARKTVEQYLRTFKEARIGKKKGRAGIGDRLEEKATKYFPLLSVGFDWAAGPGEINNLYVAGHRGYEIPIYLTKAGEREPSAEQLKQNVEKLKIDNQSPYQSGELTVPFYRGGFNDPGAEVLTGKALDELLVDPTHAREWLVRDEIWEMQQLGDRLNFEEGQQEKNISGINIRKYGSLSYWQSFSRWGLRTLAYRVLDLLFIPSRATGKNLITQYFWEEEYKAITKAYRAVMANHARPKLEFDLNFLSPAQNSQKQKKKAA